MWLVVLRGRRPERWIRQTNFDNGEAVGYLADRLARLGVEQELAKRGAVPGSQVTIGDVTFEWEPSTPAGAGALLSSRGADARLEQDDRVGADERKAARTLRRHPTPEQREAADREWLLAQAGSSEDAEDVEESEEDDR